MVNQEADIVIIGGGLTGLTLAYLLRSGGLNITILEARKRLGGRIFTNYNDHTASIELGATWLGVKHTRLLQLLKDLKIDIFEQVMGETAIYEPISTSPHQLVQLPPNSEPSYRIKGGSSILIEKLVQSIPAESILSDQFVKSITENDDYLLVKSNDHLIKTRTVISTIPPNLFAKSIKVIPGLDSKFINVAVNTHTWMGESIKIGLRYTEPFWRNGQSSGTIVSNVGPIPEMYDHSNYEDTQYALIGFLNSAYFSLERVERLEIILQQLRKYYGSQVEKNQDYQETIWRNENFTFREYNSHIIPHQNNGHPIYRNSFLNNKLFIAGSETASEFPGYMEGAVRSAEYIMSKIDI